MNWGFVLFLIAITLYLPLTFLNILSVIYKNGLRWKILNGYFYETAYDIDRFGNRNLRTLLNLTLVKGDYYKFGDERETISSVLGKNQRLGTLTTTGKALVAFLDWLDENHCEDSIIEFD